MQELKENCVTRWFGSAFNQLDPLLQDLHRNGGSLVGEVEIKLGSGKLAHWLGQRLAKKLGVPIDTPQCLFEVDISHTDNTLIWSRSFNGKMMVSCFEPVGHYPSGYWTETTGDISLQLGVDILQGAWHWQRRCTLWKGRALPNWFMPMTLAYKCIDQQQYVFDVSIQQPQFGVLLEYAGRLQPDDRPPWLKYPNTESFWGGWRQGNSEDWLHRRWFPLWNQLSAPDKLAYLEKYPPPENWQHWMNVRTQRAGL